MKLTGLGKSSSYKLIDDLNKKMKKRISRSEYHKKAKFQNGTLKKRY
ncbi:MAG: hypothetical protein L6V81_11085 [Clostridium sp.]|nr:MAG: hypothetical protein L6V81_11085 [Clostridium sp.]